MDGDILTCQYELSEDRRQITFTFQDVGYIYAVSWSEDGTGGTVYEQTIDEFAVVLDSTVTDMGIKSITLYANATAEIVSSDMVRETGWSATQSEEYGGMLVTFEGMQETFLLTFTPNEDGNGYTYYLALLTKSNDGEGGWGDAV